MHLAHHALLYRTTNHVRTSNKIKDDAKGEEIVLITAETLSISEVRHVITLAWQRPADATSRLFIINAQSIAIEAQHALLKILEEPPETSRFALVLPPGAALLPTLLSRLLVVSTENKLVHNDVFTQFLNVSYAERLSLVAAAASKKDEAFFRDVQAGLVTYTAKQSNLSPYTKQLILFVLEALPRRGAAKKMLWEEIALTLPLTVV
jgi:hypothetical protein